MLEIPFKNVPSFIEEISLDNSTYKFLFNWNSIASHWTLTVLDQYKNILVAGIRVVLDMDLFEQYVDRNLPRGKLFVVDLSNNYNSISRFDFENERKLKILYIEEGEIL